MPPKTLAELFVRVEGLGVHNINLANPTHFAPAIFEALALRKPPIPVVWNSSGYETVTMVASARGLVDVFLPDIKYGTAETATQLAGAPNYYETALAAVKAMCGQTGEPVYDAGGMMLRGTLVRHLVLPLRTGESIAIWTPLPANSPRARP